MTKDYSADLKQALGELLRMNSERSQLETQIAKQKKRVAALYELVQADDDAPAPQGLVDGITDACRTVLRATVNALSPAEVRDEIAKLGLPPQSNLLASVHTTLKRLKAAGEVEEVSGAAGVAYKWEEPSYGFKAGDLVKAMDAIAGKDTQAVAPNDPIQQLARGARFKNLRSRAIPRGFSTEELLKLSKGEK